MLFNLIPIPPLDGFQAIAPWMPEDVRGRFYEFSRYSLMALFAIFWLIAPLNYIFWLVVHGISNLLGVPADLGWYGYDAFRFWQHGGFNP